MSFLREVCDRRLRSWQAEDSPPFVLPIPADEDAAAFQDVLPRHNLTPEEMVILQLAMVPHFQPGMLDKLINEYRPQGVDFLHTGGDKNAGHKGMIPTGETALFILAGDDAEKRIDIMKYFSPNHFFATEHILHLEKLPGSGQYMSGRIILEQEYVDLFSGRSVSDSVFGNGFPSQHISTKMNWSDLALNPESQRQIEQMKSWFSRRPSVVRKGEMVKISNRYSGPSFTDRAALGKH